jgi:hypothetical protein
LLLGPTLWKSNMVIDADHNTHVAIFDPKAIQGEEDIRYSIDTQMKVIGGCNVSIVGGFNSGGKMDFQNSGHVLIADILNKGGEIFFSNPVKHVIITNTSNTQNGNVTFKNVTASLYNVRNFGSSFFTGGKYFCARCTNFGRTTFRGKTVATFRGDVNEGELNLISGEYSVEIGDNSGPISLLEMTANEVYIESNTAAIVISDSEVLNSGYVTVYTNSPSGTISVDSGCKMLNTSIGMNEGTINFEAGAKVDMCVKSNTGTITYGSDTITSDWSHSTYAATITFGSPACLVGWWYSPGPTKDPTSKPTFNPTKDPTKNPTNVPTAVPSPTPTAVPTLEPSAEPTRLPTMAPTAAPTLEPSLAPTPLPSLNPTQQPTFAPYRLVSIASSMRVSGFTNTSFSISAQNAVKKALVKVLKFLGSPDQITAISAKNGTRRYRQMHNHCIAFLA